MDDAFSSFPGMVTGGFFGVASTEYRLTLVVLSDGQHFLANDVCFLPPSVPQSIVFGFISSVLSFFFFSSFVVAKLYLRPGTQDTEVVMQCQ